MAWFRCIGNGGGSVTSIQRISETDFNSLANKDSSTIYLVCNDDNMAMELKAYVGSNRITREPNPENYEFWYEDVATSMHVNNNDWIYNLGMNPFDSDNRDKSFEIKIKLNDVYTGGSDIAILGTDSYTPTAKRYEFYVSSSDSNRYLRIWFASGLSWNTGISVLNNEVTVTRNGNTLTATDGTNTATSSFTPPDSSAPGDNSLALCGYAGSTQYYFTGVIDHIGFRYLT